MQYKLSNILLWLAFALGLAGYLSKGLSDPDLWWHITVGKWIIAHGQLPTVDLWNSFSNQVPWTPYSWSSEVVFAYFDLKFGLYGLFALKAGLALLLVMSLMFTLGRISSNMAVGALLATILVFGISDAFVLRPQTISWILLLFGVLAADKIEKEPASSFGWLGACLTLIVWANTHLTFVFGVIAVLAWLMQVPRNRKNLLLLAKVGTLLLLATVCTPHLGGEWLTLFNKLFHPYKFSYIIEFKSATIFHQGVPILVVLLILQALFYHYRPDTLHWGRVILVGSLIFAGLTAIKFLPYALISLGLLLAKTIALTGDLNSLGQTGAGLAGGTRNLESLPAKRKAIYGFCCAAFGVSMIYIHSLTPLHTKVVPKQAVDIIESYELPMPILNAFGAGGYLIYRFSDEQGNPTVQVPLDGRTNVNNPAIIDGFEAAMNGTPQWRMILNMVQPKTILWRTGGLFATLLLEHPDYCLVYPKRPADMAKQRYALFVAQSDCQRIKQRLSSSDEAKFGITH